MPKMRAMLDLDDSQALPNARTEMWVKLSGEYINLSHIVRVKANKSFKNGQDEWAVELEGVIKGELVCSTRYRGLDAELIMHALEIHSRQEPTPTADVNAPTRSTVHDVRSI